MQAVSLFCQISSPPGLGLISGSSQACCRLLSRSLLRLVDLGGSKTVTTFYFSCRNGLLIVGGASSDSPLLYDVRFWTAHR